MTSTEVKTQVEQKIAELASEALLLDEIQDACENAGHWTLAEVVEARNEELTTWRRTIHQAYRKMGW